MSLSPEQRFKLYRILFREESEAILKATEYKPYLALLSREDIKKIKKNLFKISDCAAGYYFKKYVSDKDNGDISKKKIEESLKVAVLAILNNVK